MRHIKFILFLLFQCYFFGLIFIPSNIVKFIALTLLISTICLAPKRDLVKTFNKPISIFFIFCFINMILCYANRGQTPIQFLIGNEFTSILGILTVYSVSSFRIDHRKIEKGLIVTAVLFSCCYMLQYFIYPFSLFTQGDVDVIAESARVRMPGQCLLSLAYFYSLNKLFNKYDLKLLILLLFSLSGIIILGFRSQLAVIFILSVIMIYKCSKFNKRMFIYSLLLAVTLYGVSQTEFAQYKIQQLIERNETDNFDNSDYVRYKTFDHYTNLEPKDLSERILGIGLPNGNYPYGEYIQKLKDYHIIWADWGLLGLSWVLGFPAVLCLIWYSVKAVTLKTEKEFYHLKFWLLFLIIGSILTREFFREGCFAIQGVVLYILSKAHNEQKNIIK